MGRLLNTWFEAMKHPPERFVCTRSPLTGEVTFVHTLTAVRLLASKGRGLPVRIVDGRGVLNQRYHHWTRSLAWVEPEEEIEVEG